MIPSGVEGLQQTAAPHSSDISVQYTTSVAAAPTLHELEATFINAEVQFATPLPLPDAPTEPHNNGDNDKRPPSSRSARSKYMANAMFLIVGVMAGILGTLLLSPSNENVNETALGVGGVTTIRPSSSSSFSPSSSPSGGPSGAPNTPTTMTVSIAYVSFTCARLYCCKLPYSFLITHSIQTFLHLPLFLCILS